MRTTPQASAPGLFFSEGAHDHFPAGRASPFLFHPRMRTSTVEQHAPLLPSKLPTVQAKRRSNGSLRGLTRIDTTQLHHSYLSKKRSRSLILPSLPQIKPGKEKDQEGGKNPKTKLRRSQSHTARIGPLI